MTVENVTYLCDAGSLGDIPFDDFRHHLTDHLHAQWPAAEVDVLLTTGQSHARVGLSDPVDPSPYERRAEEYAEDIFNLLCKGD